jgi:hypothetical protein
LSLGAVQLTVAEPDDAKVRVFALAMTSVGAPGLVAGVVTFTGAEAALAVLLCEPLLATTVNV